MHIFMILLVGMFACSLSMATGLDGYIPVPEDAAITEVNGCGLPRGSRVRVKKAFTYEQNYYGARHFYIKDYGGDGERRKGIIAFADLEGDDSLLVLQNTNGKVLRCDLGMRIVLEHEGTNLPDNLVHTLGVPKSVGDFNKLFGEYFQIIYPDPYANLNREAVVDIFMGKIVNSIKAGDYAAALPHFDRLLKYGGDFPESFYYYHIEALAKSGKKLLAQEKSTAYLKKYGKSGKYYDKVIEVMTHL